MRLSRVLIAAAAAAPLMLPLAAHATGIPFFGPIVPQGALTCPAAWGSVAELINNILAFAMTMAIVVAAPLSVAYGGFLYLTSATNPSARGRANAILTNTLVGTVIALSAWLIVDTILTILVAPNEGVAYWTSQMFSSGQAACLPIPTTLNQATGQTGTYLPAITAGPNATTGCPQGSTATDSGACVDSTSHKYVAPLGSSCPSGSTFNPDLGGCDDGKGNITTPTVPAPPANTGNYGISGTLCASDNTACSATALQAVGYTAAQANVMSCIAVTESSGNPNTTDNPKSGACGTFQLVPGNWAKLSQQIPGCGGASCNNASCNAQGAFLLSQNRLRLGQSAYADWTCTNCNSKAAACVQQYDPGH